MGDQPRSAFSATANSAPSLLFLALAKVARPNWMKLRVSYSITSVARSIIDGGTASPSALAVLRFTTISNLVGSWTGSSASALFGAAR